jgi:3-oxoadipate enol-lactonase
MTQAPNTERGFAEINGSRLFYEIAGSGDPLVLVHAGIADHRMWDDQVAAFAQHYRVIRYDMRGFGQSAPVDADFAHHHDLYQLLGTLGVDRAHLIGCSKGGRTAMDLALEHPDMVRSLVTVCSSPGGMQAEGDPPPIMGELIAADEAGDLDRLNELEVRLWVDGSHRTPDKVNSAIRERVREMNRIALHNEGVSTGTEQSLEPPAIDRLEAITMPVLVVTGDLDVPPTQQAARIMGERIPNARTAVIENTAHLPNMERPDEFNRIVLEFLAEL